MSEFNPLGAGVLKERECRIENGKKLLKFGNPFLDEALGGIGANDLIIIASKTGQGKTQLAMHIALNNILNGKRVHFFALESEKYEIERRLKYQIIADQFFKLSEKRPIHLNYIDWYYGRLDHYLSDLEEEAEAKLIYYKNLFVFYRENDFKVNDFQRLVLGVKNETDLIIADHLHYFDFDDENENRAIKNTVKSIRDTALLSGKPVILISHVRKSDRKLKQIVPDIEDLHGSSDIGKIGTKVITIAPCYDDSQMTLRKTYFHSSKCRIDGSRTNLTAILAFNLVIQRYENEYFLGRLNYDGTELKLFNSTNMPFWAKSAKNGKI